MVGPVEALNVVICQTALTISLGFYSLTLSKFSFEDALAPVLSEQSEAMGKSDAGFVSKLYGRSEQTPRGVP
jgi:hypothetical protein